MKYIYGIITSIKLICTLLCSYFSLTKVNRSTGAVGTMNSNEYNPHSYHQNSLYNVHGRADAAPATSSPSTAPLSVFYHEYAPR